MDEFYFKRSHVPAFGSWDCNDDLPFTQCFETATKAAGFLRYSYSEEDRDLYVAGDLYENDVVTPAMIVVPRKKAKKPRCPKVKEDEKKEEANWVVCNYDYDYDGYYGGGGGGDVKEPPSPVSLSGSPPPPPSRSRTVPKAVDEDLYKISPELLRAEQRKKKKGWGLFSSCLQPTCVC